MLATFGTVLAGRALVRGGGDPRAGVVIGLLVQNLLSVALAVFFAAAHAKPRAVDFGLRRPPLLRAAGVSTAVGLGLFVLSAAWVGALGLDDSGPSITDRLVADQSTSHALLVLLMVAVAVPLGEEFVFRGCVPGPMQLAGDMAGCSSDRSLLRRDSHRLAAAGRSAVYRRVRVRTLPPVPLDGLAVRAPLPSRSCQLTACGHRRGLDLADSFGGGLLGRRHTGDRSARRGRDGSTLERIDRALRSSAQEVGSSVRLSQSVH